MADPGFQHRGYSCGDDFAVATTLRVTARHQLGAGGAPLQPGEAGSESSRPPSLHPLEPSPSPPPLAPARASEIKDPHDLQATPKVQLAKAKRAPEIKDLNILRTDPKVELAQAKRFATGVLEHYNKKKKNKFELVDAKPVISIPEPRCCYTHINFTARSSKEDSKEQLFFAEIKRCTRRRAPNGFIVTCCEPLGRDSRVGLKFCEPEGTSAVRKNADFRHCFGCTERILHPRGENYIAGHCIFGYDYMI